MNMPGFAAERSISGAAGNHDRHVDAPHAQGNVVVPQLARGILP